MLFVATWMNLEIAIPSERRQRKRMPYNILYMQNLKQDTMNLCAKQKQVHTQKTNLGSPSGKGDKFGVWDYVYATLYIQ